MGFPISSRSITYKLVKTTNSQALLLTYWIGKKVSKWGGACSSQKTTTVKLQRVLPCAVWTHGPRLPLFSALNEFWGSGISPNKTGKIPPAPVVSSPWSHKFLFYKPNPIVFLSCFQKNSDSPVPRWFRPFKMQPQPIFPASPPNIFVCLCSW